MYEYIRLMVTGADVTARHAIYNDRAAGETTPETAAYGETLVGPLSRRLLTEQDIARAQLHALKALQPTASWLDILEAVVRSVLSPGVFRTTTQCLPVARITEMKFTADTWP